MVLERINEKLQLKKIGNLHSKIMSYNPENEEPRLHSNTISVIQRGMDNMAAIISKSRSLNVWIHGMEKLDAIKHDFNNSDVRRVAAQYQQSIESRYKKMFREKKSFKGYFQKKD